MKVIEYEHDWFDKRLDVGEKPVEHGLTFGLARSQFLSDLVERSALAQYRCSDVGPEAQRVVFGRVYGHAGAPARR